MHMGTSVICCLSFHFFISFIIRLMLNICVNLFLCPLTKCSTEMCVNIGMIGPFGRTCHDALIWPSLVYRALHLM